MLNKDRLAIRGIHKSSSAIQLISLSRGWKACNENKVEFEKYLRNELVFMIETIFNDQSGFDAAKQTHGVDSRDFVKDLCELLGCRNVSEFREIIDSLPLFTEQTSPVYDKTTPEYKAFDDFLDSAFTKQR